MARHYSQVIKDRALELLQDHESKVVAERLGVSRDTIETWRKKWKREGKIK